jgi:hypothetical protein
MLGLLSSVACSRHVDEHIFVMLPGRDANFVSSKINLLDPGFHFGTSVGIRVGPNRHLGLLAYGIDANRLLKRATHRSPIFLAAFRGRSRRFNGEYWRTIIIGRKQRDSRALLDCLCSRRESMQWHLQSRGMRVVPLVHKDHADWDFVGILVGVGKLPSNVQKKSLENAPTRQSTIQAMI